eukprot:TRINITY_DN6290_c0_g1_i5.p1 TRINITY_DN6290_c0_g1~~TRINITY_DN6290_c0_g1_i5.p1  ORF type:complete len:187 (+),score=43.42 TRINITY_DN6290_c0_g1_i5:228-788(+)
MLCEKCKKNEATINLVKIVNGEKQEIWLCEECAKNISDIPFFNSMGKDINFPFQGILTEVISNMKHTLVQPEKLICSNCETTYDEFSKTGKLGCSMCYNKFSEQLENILKYDYNKVKHIGKIPKKNQMELSQKKKLKNLKEKLQRLILEEQYEEAAIIRDNIQELEKKILDDFAVEDGFIKGGKMQ